MSFVVIYLPICAFLDQFVFHTNVYVSVCLGQLVHFLSRILVECNVEQNNHIQQAWKVWCEQHGISSPTFWLPVTLILNQIQHNGSYCTCFRAHGLVEGDLYIGALFSIHDQVSLSAFHQYPSILTKWGCYWDWAGNAPPLYCSFAAKWVHGTGRSLNTVRKY